MPNFQDSYKVKNFIPAKLHQGTESFVYCSAIHPETGKMKRKRWKINHVKNKRDQQRYARHLIEKINNQLYSGWNPWTDHDNTKSVELLTNAIVSFINRKEKELRAHSMRSYHSYTRIFKDYLDIKNMNKYTVSNFSKIDANDFMSYVYDTKDVSANTYNNYRNFFKLLWNWFIENQYAKDNIFEHVGKKKTTEKERIIIPAKDLNRIFKYFKNNDELMYMTCLLVYHTLIRPTEITFLKPIHFNIENQTIQIPAHAAKARKSRITTMPDTMIDALGSWKFNFAKDDEYIFGTNLMPGEKRLDPKRFAKKWSKMRKVLSMPKKYQLYSLRDCGIVDLLKQGVSADEVMKQAGHSSLEITTIYARHFNYKGSEEIKGKSKQY